LRETPAEKGMLSFTYDLAGLKKTPTGTEIG